jgi:hypothetical protein
MFHLCLYQLPVVCWDPTKDTSNLRGIQSRHTTLIRIHLLKYTDIVACQLLSTIRNIQRVICLEFWDFTATKHQKKGWLFNESTIETGSLTYRLFTSSRLLYWSRAQDFTKQNQDKIQILLDIPTYIQAVSTKIKKLAKISRNRLRTTIIVWNLSNKKRRHNFYTNNTC